MEIYDTRLGLRNSLQARLGYGTNDASSPLVVDRFNEYLKSAARTVYGLCKSWTNIQRKYFTTLAIDQRLISYPADCDAANIMQVGCWDSGTLSYRLLQRARIQIPLDEEPLLALFNAGDPDALVQWPARRAFPLFYETKDTLEIWPRPDMAYQMKIDYVVSPELAHDTDTCIVDGECIILLALADAYDSEGDAQLADNQRKKFNARIAQLRSRQHSAELFQLGRMNRLVANGARVRDGRVFMPTDIPNSGTWPSVVPP